MNNFSAKKILLAMLSLILCSTQSFSYSSQFADRNRTTPLRWRKVTVVISLSNSLVGSPLIKSQNEIEEILDSSIDTWNQEVRFNIRRAKTDAESLSPSRSFGDGISLLTNAPTAENLEFFSGRYSEAAARTRVFFDRRGTITEADIVLNPRKTFSDNGEFGTFDLESTLTHEIGHLLGLEHSDLPGATMNANVGRNGFYGVPNFSGRTLSRDDIAGIRALYGNRIVTNECCGTIEGRALVSGSIDSDVQIKVWAQDKSTGAIAAIVKADARGQFKIAGIEPNDYEVFCQIEGKKSLTGLFGVTSIGTASVSKLNTSFVSGQVFADVNKRRTFLFGTNGLLSKVAVPMVAGGKYSLLIGAEDSTDNFEIEPANTQLNVFGTSSQPIDYGDGLNVFTFEIGLSAEIATGDYSIILQDGSGNRYALIGAITIED